MSGRGGRKPGALNRRTRLAQERVAELGDPLAFLAEVMAGQELGGQRPNIDQRLRAAAELRKVLVPTPVGRPVALTMPVDSNSDLRPAIGAVLQAMAAGDLSPVEAESALRVISLARTATAEESSRANAVDIDELLGGRFLR